MENRLKNEIVGLIAAGVMVKRSSINVLHPSPKYGVVPCKCSRKIPKNLLN